MIDAVQAVECMLFHGLQGLAVSMTRRREQINLFLKGVLLNPLEESHHGFSDELVKERAKQVCLHEMVPK